MAVNLAIRPRLADLVRLAGPLDAEARRIESAMELALEAKETAARDTAGSVRGTHGISG